MSMLLHGLFAAGLGAPFFLAASADPTHAARRRWRLLGGLAIAVALCADPLAVALQQVDGALTLTLCRA